MKSIGYLFLFAFAVLVSCKKEEPVFAAPDSSYGLIYNKIFTPSCALSGCHASEDHEALNHSHGVTLEGETAYTSIISGLPKNASALAADLRIVFPNDAEKSFLFHKINYENSKFKFGAPMPGGGLVVTKNQIEFVKQWINAGAPLQGHVADKSLMN